MMEIDMVASSREISESARREAPGKKKKKIEECSRKNAGFAWRNAYNVTRSVGKIRSATGNYASLQRCYEFWRIRTNGNGANDDATARSDRYA